MSNNNDGYLFNVGDTVVETNDYGVDLGTKTITERVKISYSNSGNGYYITPTDTPWFAVKEENLKQPD